MNLLLDQPPPERIRGFLTPPDSPPILPAASSSAWSHVFGRADLAPVLAVLLDRARNEAVAPLPALTDELYREFHRSGSRDVFQKAYYERRRRLGRAQIGLLAGPPAESAVFTRSFLAKLEAILAEKSWALPAHVKDPGGQDPDCIDLAAAETAHLLAEALVVFGDRVPASLRKRVLARLRSGIFETYLRHADGLFWPVCTHNWNAVCHHGVLGAALAVETDLDLLATLLASAAPRLARFLDGFTADGGCSEGVDYWSYGFGNFAALNELLEVRTGGALSLFAGHERIRAIARFAPALSLAGGRIVNFSDAKNIPVPAWLLAYLGTRLREEGCRRQAAENFRALYLDPARPVDYDAFNATFSHWQRVFRHAPVPSRAVSSAPPPDAFFPDLGVWAARGVDRSGVLWELAAKGGHNAEHHNHNDVGSFILNLDGVPMLTEIGAPEYVKDYFVAEKRYGFLAARSLGHSLPVIHGREQDTGAAFSGKIMRAELDRDEIVFELDFTAAYPAEAQLSHGLRRLTLRKRAGELRIEDEFELATAVPVESALITDAPIVSIVNDREAVIEKAGKRLRLRVGAGARWDRVETLAYRDHFFQDARISRLVLRPARCDLRVSFVVAMTLETADAGAETPKQNVSFAGSAV